MSHTLMVVPVGANVGLTAVSLGLVDAIAAQDVRVSFFKPILQERHGKQKIDSELDQIRKNFALNPPESIRIERAEQLISKGKLNDLLEEIVAIYHADKSLEDIMSYYQQGAKNTDIVVVKGLSYQADQPYALHLNVAIAKTLDAKVILVAAPEEQTPEGLTEQIKAISQFYDDLACKRVLGCILNKVDTEHKKDKTSTINRDKFLAENSIKLLGCIPSHAKLAHKPEEIDEFVTKYLYPDWIQELVKTHSDRRLSGPVFCYQLDVKARAANKRIILPESDDPRTIRAAAICTRRNLARCVLLGKKNEIEKIAKDQGIELNDKIEIIDSEEVRENYVEPLVALRKHKGLTAEAARESLQDNIMLATMMLQQDEVDGLVSGALHTTAHTIRPALQLIKTPPNVQLVSSVFFMCLPDQVLVYADCAINQDPTAEELADIAIQSAESAAAMGVVPRVALISFSTYQSASGPLVDKIHEALRFAKSKRPDLMIDGPLQYDAAIDPEIGSRKAPESKVAGKATVFVFPDLNTANTVYKAVQRSTGILCIGPLLQGLRKPVNDLSRGCSTEDIVYTIAITAIQASAVK